MEEFDQGTVLYGIRSERYPNINCYAIIISASCDIANCKVEKIYYLVGVNAKEWFSTEYGYNQVYDEKIKCVFNKFQEIFKRNLLSAELIQNFSLEDIQLIIGEDVDEKRKKQLWEAYNEYSMFCRLNMQDTDRLNAIKKDTKPIKNFLKDVIRGRIFHYYFLPEDSYLGNGKKDSGLIIDLQEIDSIPLDDISKIKSPGIDSLILSTYEKQEMTRLIKKYFLETEDDFVAIEGSIVSPWREHLMQKFSQDFIRIGIESPTDNDIERLIKTYIKEEKQ